MLTDKQLDDAIGFAKRIRYGGEPLEKPELGEVARFLFDLVDELREARRLLRHKVFHDENVCIMCFEARRYSEERQ